jgi:hypothetical protein
MMYLNTPIAQDPRRLPPLTLNRKERAHFAELAPANRPCQAAVIYR